jgi:hypothetical protein
MVIWVGIDDFFYAMSIDERSNIMSWQPILWPRRGVIPLACLLLFIQGISEQSLWAALGQFLVHQEKLKLYGRRPDPRPGHAVRQVGHLRGLPHLLQPAVPRLGCSAPSGWAELTFNLV